MPRRHTRFHEGLVYHVWNRGVRRATLFYTAKDYQAFLTLLADVQARFPTVRLLAWCVMPNHWHLVLWPLVAGASEQVAGALEMLAGASRPPNRIAREDCDLTTFMYRFTQMHAVRWERVHGTRGTGPVYQGRFRDSVITTPTSLYTACSYAEANPFTKRMVDRAEDWPWSSATLHPPEGTRPIVAAWPIPKPPAEEWSRILTIRDKRTRRCACALVAARLAPSQSAPWLL